MAGAMSRHVVAPLRELPAGARKRLTVKGRPIVVFNLHGEFFGLLDRCPHQGAPLSAGLIGGLARADQPGKICYMRQGEFIRCPWHGWEFDIRTGQSWCDPERVRTRSYPVAVAQGGALVQGPYVTETFPVTVGEDYVVIEV
jgi:3-phenylpropionate/trans-cinnamate dioxygenase ferredoxin subunit